MCNQHNANQEKLIEKLTALGFVETDGSDRRFVKDSDSDSVIFYEAYINGTGVIFHLNSNGRCIAITIQTVDDKDIDEAFREIKLFTNEMNRTT